MAQPHAPQFSGIFVSYRRDDSSGHAGRLFDNLAKHFGEDQIFMDIDTIEPGEDFVQVIENAVGSCEIVVAVMGQRWLSAGEGSSRRLDNPNDFVRLEIATALKRNIRVIPVLVQKATMPRPDDLPEDIALLSRRNAVELSDSRWQYDVDKLLNVLEKVLKSRQEAREAQAARQAEEERGRQENDRRQRAEEEERRRLAAEEAKRSAADKERKALEETRRAEDKRRIEEEISRKALEEKRRVEAENQRLVRERESSRPEVKDVDGHLADQADKYADKNETKPDLPSDAVKISSPAVQMPDSKVAPDASMAPPPSKSNRTRTARNIVIAGIAFIAIVAVFRVFDRRRQTFNFPTTSETVNTQASTSPQPSPSLPRNVIRNADGSLKPASGYRWVNPNDPTDRA